MIARAVFRTLMIGAVQAAILLFAGCGGGNNPSGGSNNNPPPGSTTTQFRIGDAPADRVLSFEVSIGPIAAAGPSGNVTILPNPRRFELTHIAGTSEPLVIMGLTQGSYSGASFTVGNAEVTWIGSNGQIQHLSDSSSSNLTLSFSPAITVTSASSVFGVELLVGNLLTFNPYGDISGFNMANSMGYMFSAGPVGTPGPGQLPEGGLMEDMRGMVTAVSGNSFTMTMGMSGTSLTVTTDANTQFSNGINGVASMMNRIVKVEGGTLTDGTLYAAECEGIEDQNGMEVEGLVSAVNPGAPAAATGLVLLAHDGVGNGMMNTILGGQFTVNLSGTSYQINGSNMGTITQTFSSTTMVPGQRVDVESTSGMGMGGGGMMGDITAQTVTLEKQTVSGVVTNYTSTGVGSAAFDIQLPVDSYITLLNPGMITIHVIQQLETDVHNLPNGIFNSLIVHVRGLLFYDPITGFTMMARRVGP